MAEDIIRGYVGKVVVIEIDQQSKPRYISDGETYVGKLRAYDGCFLQLGPYVRGKTGKNIEQTIAELEQEFARAIESMGNTEPQEPEVISKATIARMRKSRAANHPDEQQRFPRRE